MTVWKTNYNFYQFYFKFSFFNLFNSVCKHWSTKLRRFGVLGGAQQMFFVLFPQESFFRDAGYSVHSSVLLVEMNWHLQFIKDLFTFENKFVTEAVLENCIQTVHVLLVETECIQFLQQLFNVYYWNNVISSIG